VSIIDIVIIAIFFFTFYFVISQPGYRYFEGLSVFALMAWYTSGVSHASLQRLVDRSLVAGYSDGAPFGCEAYNVECNRV